jgi:tetratricopeptide (TPR) repeat protein
MLHLILSGVAVRRCGNCLALRRALATEVIYVAACILAVAGVLAPAHAQSPESTGTAVVHGSVRDSNRNPLANAIVTFTQRMLQQGSIQLTETTHTDSEGHYRFAALRAGAYALSAEMAGYDRATAGPVNLAPNQTTEIDLVLAATKAPQLPNASATTPPTAKPATPAPEFFDEPQFTVAGVTQTTSMGAHGSDTVLRTTETLAKATVSLSKESSESSSQSSTRAASAATEASLRDALARAPNDFDANRKLGKFLVGAGKPADALPYLEQASQINPNSKDPEIHRLLGDVEEQLRNPLQAVREYQRAAELDPSEANLFDWGAELLAHRALEPATEIFTKGNRRFPNSVRMLVALGVTWYVRGDHDQAANCLVSASDLAPNDPSPYLFLGRMQSAQTAPSASTVERLARFAQLQPDNALANYFYAVALSKQSPRSVEHDHNAEGERSARVEALLLKAVRLDPNLAAAYLQLGILYSERADFPQAISAYQKAIATSSENDETLEQAHYRLAQAYRSSGQEGKAQAELELHAKLALKTLEDRERERREVLQFVIALRNQASTPPRQP